MILYQATAFGIIVLVPNIHTRSGKLHGTNLSSFFSRPLPPTLPLCWLMKIESDKAPRSQHRKLHAVREDTGETTPCFWNGKGIYIGSVSTTIDWNLANHQSPIGSSSNASTERPYFVVLAVVYRAPNLLYHTRLENTAISDYIGRTRGFFLWFCGPVNFFPNIYDSDLCSVGGLLRGLLPAHYRTLGPVTYFVCDFPLTLKKVTCKFFYFF